MEVLKNLEAILAEAKEAAVAAANEMYEKIGGDRLACGFAWVDIYEYDGKKIRANSKLGKALAANGIEKSDWKKCFDLWNPSGLSVQNIEKSDYKKCFDLWNPCGLYVQNIDIKEAGAQAYAKVLRNYGFEAWCGSRLD
jgi:hypothetical protein